MVENGLKKGMKQFILSGKFNEKNKFFIAATENYFKVILHAIDFYIYKIIKKLPDNHTERFAILKDLDDSLYKLIGELFKIYRKSYREDISKEEFERIKNGLEKTLKITELEEEFKKYL